MLDKEEAERDCQEEEEEEATVFGRSTRGVNLEILVRMNGWGRAPRIEVHLNVVL